jgi:uncharacterized repeat protein (TIGR01451 family)
MKPINANLKTGLMLGLLLSALNALSGDTLSISVTNKSGDVFTNLSVSRVLPEGLVLESRSGQVKVKYEDLPSGFREKYEPLALATRKKEMQQAQVTAAYFARQQQNQAEQERLRATVQKNREQHQLKTGEDVAVDIPNQGWKITIPNVGFGSLDREVNNDAFVCRGIGQDGLNLSVFVETPGGSGTGNDAVLNYYWPKASRNPLIDQKSVHVENKEKFAKVSYTTLDIANANYYFAFKGKWVDLHVSKPARGTPADALFADFETRLSYGE